MPPTKAPMPTAAVCAQPTPAVLVLVVLVVKDEDVEVALSALKADCAVSNAADALLTLAATWLSWELMDEEVAASAAVESRRLSEEEAEPAEAVRFAYSLLIESIASDKTHSPTVSPDADAELGNAAANEVKF
ncbi:hypothetical protein diail_617 [Diaporthe ilicicola]|nr:hypothetical protein diail_617 [Diaporthe ilicicola]